MNAIEKIQSHKTIILRVKSGLEGFDTYRRAERLRTHYLNKNKTVLNVKITFRKGVEGDEVVFNKI